jgi:hypothetical protein
VIKADAGSDAVYNTRMFEGLSRVDRVAEAMTAIAPRCVIEMAAEGPGKCLVTLEAANKCDIQNRVSCGEQ